MGDVCFNKFDGTRFDSKKNSCFRCLSLDGVAYGSTDCDDGPANQKRAQARFISQGKALGR